MPTYEYECHGCHRRIEIQQRISDPALTACPDCGAKVERIIGARGGFLIKGSAQGPSGCAFTETGTTCCGRQQRCDKPGCDSGD